MFILQEKEAKNYEENFTSINEDDPRGYSSDDCVYGDVLEPIDNDTGTEKETIVKEKSSQQSNPEQRNTVSKRSKNPKNQFKSKIKRHCKLTLGIFRYQ